MEQERALADRLATHLYDCREDSCELLGERGWWKDEPRCGYAKRYNETAENVAAADKALTAWKEARKHPTASVVPTNSAKTTQDVDSE
jgi:hypothetical protein